MWNSFSDVKPICSGYSYSQIEPLTTMFPCLKIFSHLSALLAPGTTLIDWRRLSLEPENRIVLIPMHARHFGPCNPYSTAKKELSERRKKKALLCTRSSFFYTKKQLIAINNSNVWLIFDLISSVITIFKLFSKNFQIFANPRWPLVDKK